MFDEKQQMNELLKKLKENLKTFSTGKTVFIFTTILESTKKEECFLATNCSKEDAIKLMIQSACNLIEDISNEIKIDIMTSLIIDLMENNCKSRVKYWLSETSKYVESYERVSIN